MITDQERKALRKELARYANESLIYFRPQTVTRLLDALDAADEENAALKRDAERWREVERRIWYDPRLDEWAGSVDTADTADTFTEAIDAAIAERKRKDQP